jgi:purine nucleosidase
MANTQVVFNHDAAIDEYMATVLLTTMEGVDLQGIVITNADCIADQAMGTAWKVQQFIERTEIPLALSNARGWNPFPWSYRSDCIKEGNVPSLSTYGYKPDWPPYPSGEDLMKKSLSDAVQNSAPVTMLINCPLTTLYNVLSADPALEKGIGRLIWMGGAINVPGNLDPTTIPPQVANPNAEWNAFWDPVTVDWVFKNTSFPITLFPLDVTDQAAITPQFMSSLRTQSLSYSYSELAYESYDLVANEAFYDMWDVVTTCYIPHPEFFDPPTEMSLSIITEGFNQGTLIQVESGGREVEVILNLASASSFYDYVLAQFKR